MRAYEFLTEAQLDEINRRNFLRKAGIAAVYTGLGLAAADQAADQAVRSNDSEEDSDEDEDEQSEQ